MDVRARLGEIIWPGREDHLRALLLQARLTREWDESKHPREPAGTSEGGQFASGGGGTSASETAAGEAKLDPKVIEVGGDEWNKATARRLESEYQRARPFLDSLTKDAVKLSAQMGGKVVVEGEEEEEEPLTLYPESWDELSDSDQQSVEDAYVEEMTPKFLDDEQQNWYDSGGALDDAKNSLAWDFTKQQKWEWAQDALNDVQEEYIADGKPLPFSTEQLLNNMTVEYSGNGEGSEDPDIEFDDKGLDSEPVAGVDPAQQTLPGIEEPKPSERLTEKMREEIKDALVKAFNKEAEDYAPKMDPPEYLSDNASEFAGEYWSQMSDKEKFDWGYEHDKVDKPESESADAPAIDQAIVEALPKKFDPLNETTGVEYQRTQRLARFLSVARAREILQERGLKVPTQARMAAIDKKLWESWKGSSTSQNGVLLQVATAQELGGRLNMKNLKGNSATAVRNWADEHYAEIGGYDGIKAYIRGKWETTQYLLDRAGEQELGLYRGIDLKSYDAAHYDQAVKEKGVKQLVTVGGGRESGTLKYEKAPTIVVDRNGAASMTTDASVANGWKSHGGVVLRALVPRTAAISVPAYGVNIQSEHEVVVAGTAWKSWDAWLDKAPFFDMVPMGEHGSGIGTSAPKLAA